jgi:hypothetical protein
VPGTEIEAWTIDEVVAYEYSGHGACTAGTNPQLEPETAPLWHDSSGPQRCRFDILDESLLEVLME